MLQTGAGARVAARMNRVWFGRIENLVTPPVAPKPLVHPKPDELAPVKAPARRV